MDLFGKLLVSGLGHLALLVQMATIPVVCGGKSKSLIQIIQTQVDSTTYLELDDINAVLVVDELNMLELDGLVDVQLVLVLERALAKRTM